MKLNVLERISVLQILPKESNIAMLKIVRDLQGLLALSEAEVISIGFKVEGDNMLWNEKKAVDKDINFGEVASKMIADELKKLDGANSLKASHLSLWEKFVDVEGENEKK